RPPPPPGDQMSVFPAPARPLPPDGRGASLQDVGPGRASYWPALVTAGGSPAIAPASTVGGIESRAAEGVAIALGITVARFSRFGLPTVPPSPPSSGNAPSSTTRAQRTMIHTATMSGAASMGGGVGRRRADIV